MTFRLLINLVELVKCRPLPHWIAAIYLSARWRCFVSTDCRIYYPFNIKIGRGTRLIGRITIIANGEVTLGSGVEIWEGTLLHCQNGRIVIEDDTAIGPNACVYGAGHVVIGKKCSIAAKTTIASSSHRHESVSIPIREQGNENRRITIEDDVWICAGVTLAYGVTVGRGAIVGANSFVRKDVPSMSVVAGVPAHIIRRRDQRRVNIE